MQKRTKQAEKAQVSQKALAGVRDELKKVTWPTRDETMRLTGIVIAISLIIASYIGIIDVLLAKLLEIVA